MLGVDVPASRLRQYLDRRGHPESRLAHFAGDTVICVVHDDADSSRLQPNGEGSLACHAGVGASSHAKQLGYDAFNGRAIFVLSKLGTKLDIPPIHCPVLVAGALLRRAGGVVASIADSSTQSKARGLLPRVWV